MDRFEYAVGLFSLIVGLGLADMAVSLHRLLKHRAQTRWTAFAMIAAGLVAFRIVTMWYDLWTLRQGGAHFDIWFYLQILVELFVLFLAASAVLPDEAEDSRDLAAYHERHGPYLWTLMALFQASYAAHWIWFKWDRLVGPAALDLLPKLIMALAPLVAYVVLARARHPGVRLAVLLLTFGCVVIDYMNVRF